MMKPIATNRPVALAAYIRDLAAWHRQKALEPGHDGELGQTPRHEAFASYLEQLPMNDVRLLALSQLTHLTEDGVPAPGPRLSSALAELETYPAVAFDALLDYLVHLAIDDALASHDAPLPLLVEASSHSLAEI